MRRSADRDGQRHARQRSPPLELEELFELELDELFEDELELEFDELFEDEFELELLEELELEFDELLPATMIVPSLRLVMTGDTCSRSMG
ncbi:hypothetical protein [Inquilinus sp. OTU3971]|uniref:hypothetical protein n=1 Tax=Inquilinus sp. OTU3971 TaxID=3043855 RepID=UPI00313CAA99